MHLVLSKGVIVAKNKDYAQAVGYPTVAQIQSVLQPHEVFMTYFPTFKARRAPQSRLRGRFANLA